MKLKTKLILFTVLICVTSILSISVINYVVAIDKLKENVDGKFNSEVMALLKRQTDGWDYKRILYMKLSKV